MMKMKSCRLVLIPVILSLLCLPAAAVGIVERGDINIQQRRGQVSFFNDALAEFGASSPEQAISLWVKGDETRNGIYKYSVASKELKAALIKRWGSPEDSFWIIGGSSPMLSGHQVLNMQKIDNSQYKATIKYDWWTSAGPSPSSQETLTIVKVGGKWCVTAATGNGNY